MIAFAAVKWGWLAAAVALAGWIVARRHRHKPWQTVAEALAAVVLVLVGAGVVQLPNAEKVLTTAGETLGSWTYLLVGLLAFLETGAFIGLVAPGETAVLVGGLVAGQGRISLVLLVALVWACAVAGDLTSYTLGRRLGRAWLVRHGARLKITEERLQQVEGFFERHGGMTILVGRFIGFVRAIAPFVAGTSRMPLRRFLPYDVVGAGLWGTALCVLGYVFWRSFSRLTTYVSRGLLGFGIVVALVVGVVALVRLRRDEAQRERVKAYLGARADRRGWGLAARVSGPLWRGVGRPAAAGADAGGRFVFDRLTPGGLGLELTTLLALLGVGTAAFLVLGDDLGRGLGARADRLAFSAVRPFEGRTLQDVAKVVTWLGSAAVTGALALATGAWALARRRWLDAGALVLGYGLSVLAVHVAKAAYDRPRPSGALVGTALSSFPSGHALYAVTLLACATVLVRGGVGWAGRVALETVALVLVAVVAITRLYLRAHFLTDVLGGVTLGVAIWSLAGVLMLLAGHVRHNAPAPT